MRRHSSALPNLRVPFLWLSLALVSLLPVQASGQEELFQQGNQRYQQNDYDGALEAYGALLHAGLESADLYYNLGNTFFKTGDLGRSILNYERALKLRPGDSDTRANLELARSLTADEIEPLPRFWFLSVLSWWINLLPRGSLSLLTALAYLVGMAGMGIRILSRHPGAAPLGNGFMMGGGLALLLFGTTLLAREGVLGGAEWGIILTEEVAVQSAPSDEGDLTLFHVHEGTKVRLDQRTEEWSEVVLEDGRVGWVRSGVLESI